ncbi:uncharacterized protein LOC117105695 [Anneissia japonica]|uniref:uncharacterized protein LOC117105695 n=1 Tax=Anneissia japonica TaxID=1529436 RepID=UPI00142562A1|nr:uncharacterized protein LOC117105695 [Anneissia japonica]
MGGQGVRFGRKTGATLKRPRGGRRYGAGHHTICKKEKNVVENYGLISNQLAEQFDDGDLESHVLDNGVQYSLNKRKRWAIPGILKENMLTSTVYEENDFEVLLVERQVLGHATHGKRADCIAVHSSKGAKRCRKPRKTFSHADDLISNARPSEKPNSSRKKKVKASVVEETDDPSPLIPEVQYVVSYPRPVDSFPHFNPSRDSKVKIKSKQKRFRNAHLLMDDQLDIDGAFWEEDDIQPESFENNSTHKAPNLGQFITTLTSSNAKVKHKKKAVVDLGNGPEDSRPCPNKLAKHPVKYFGKDSKVIIQKKPKRPQQKKAKVIKSSKKCNDDDDDDLEDNCQDVQSICINVCRRSSRSGHLLERFGEDYVEGESLPKKFSVNISAFVTDVLKSAGHFNLVRKMQFWGHECHVVFATDITEANEARPTDYNRMRLSLFGFKNLNWHIIYLDVFETSLANSRIYSVSEVVDTIKRLLAVHPPKPLDFDSLCLNMKPHIPLKNLSSAMNLQVEVMAPCRALKLNTQPNRTIEGPQDELSVTTMETMYCGICDDYLLSPGNRSPALAMRACQHWFCSDCWRSHIESRLQRGDHTILCPGYACKVPVDKLTLMSLIPGDQFFRHKMHAQNRYLEGNPEWHWCPRPHCGRVARMQGYANGKGFLNCDCGLQSCLECKAEVHWPATCQQVEEYRRNMKKTSESLKNNRPTITQVEVKRCPTCYLPMEKNGGCRVMRCRCEQQFCWDCLSKKGYDCPCRGIDNIKKLEVIRLDPIPVFTEYTLVQQALNHNMTVTGLWNRRKLQRTAKTVVTKMFLKTYEPSSKLDVLIPTQATPSSWSDVPKLQQLLALTHEVLQFFFETKKILEYCCVRMSNYSKRSRGRDFVSQVARLEYIVRRLEEILRGNCRQQYTLEATESILRSLLLSGNNWLKLLVHQASNS